MNIIVYLYLGLDFVLKSKHFTLLITDNLIKNRRNKIYTYYIVLFQM